MPVERELGWYEAFEQLCAAWNHEGPAAGVAVEMVVMRLPGALIAGRLIGETNEGEPTTVEQELQCPINSSDSHAGL